MIVVFLIEIVREENYIEKLFFSARRILESDFLYLSKKILVM